MCQLKIKLIHGEHEELLAQNVCGVLVEGDGVVLTHLFEAPRTLHEVTVAGIDSLTGTVLLRATQ